MFTQPVVVGSVLVAALRAASAEWRDAIKELLFDPMLLNYGGALRDHLRGIAADDPAFEAVQDVLTRIDAYIAGLEAAGTIKELHPSEYRRQLERIRMMDFNREVNKKARRQSIFHDIVHRSVLLHGRHSITFVDGVNGERRPVEMKLHTFEHSIEWPRMETGRSGRARPQAAHIPGGAIHVMKLILRQFLSSLRDWDELDAILPALLSELGFDRRSWPRPAMLGLQRMVPFVGTSVWLLPEHTLALPSLRPPL